MVFQYISLPMKYTVSGSILQYNVGLTLSFLRLISRVFLLLLLLLISIIRYAFEWTGTECHGILRYGKIYEYSLFVCLFTNTVQQYPGTVYRGITVLNGTNPPGN